MVFSGKAKSEFEVESVTSAQMEVFISACESIYRGKPYWINEKDGIKTVNFAKFICSELSKLATLGMMIWLEGDNARVNVLQSQVDAVRDNIRTWVEYAGASGTVFLKPNGKSIDVVLPGKYMVTDSANGTVRGIVFVNQQQVDKVYYTRLEYHRWIDGLYVITNKCFRGSNENDATKSVNIVDTPWKGMEEEVAIQNIDSPLFGVLSMPGANNIDYDSALALPIFSETIEELKDLDIAYSRNVKEILDSKRTVLIDADRLIPMPGKYYQTAEGRRETAGRMGLPDYVNVLDGSSDGTDLYHEINPELNTETRIKGINALLSQIGFKCGFSNGYFVFNESTGFTTATQVTADQARTIQLVDDVRRNLVKCLIDTIKAVNVFEDLYGSTGHIEIKDTVDTVETERVIHIHFLPIYTNAEEDRARALQLTNSGYYPKWYYLHKYEGLSEEEAKAMIEEAEPKEQGLFDE